MSVDGIKPNEDITVINDKEREDITDITVNEGIAVIKGGPTTIIVTAAAEAKLDKESQSKEDEDWEDSWENEESMPSLRKVVNKKPCNMPTKKGGNSHLDGKKGGRRVAVFLTLYPKLMTCYFHLMTSWQLSVKIMVEIKVVNRRK